MRQRILKKLEAVEASPFAFVERLTTIDAWKLRVGNHRLILDVDEKNRKLIVHRVGHRKNVYDR